MGRKQFMQTSAQNRKASRIKITIDDESSYQYQNTEPLPDIIDACQNSESISMESHNLENQRSKNYAKTLSQTCQQEVDRILPQDPSGESSLLQNNHSKSKSMSQEYDMGLTLAGISLMFVL